MLILTRRIHEKLVIVMDDGRVATIDVDETYPNRVRFVIDAPKSIIVHRTAGIAPAEPEPSYNS